MVLNHSDRLAEEDASAVAQDLARLVHSEGLADVPVLLASARTGRGIQGLLSEIAQAATTRSVAAEAVRADLVAAGRQLEQALARDAEPVLPDVEGLIAALARAAGIDARADAAAEVAAGRSTALPTELAAPLAAVAQIRLEWVDAATAGLPVAWRTVVDDAVLAAGALAKELNTSLAATDWPPVRVVAGLRGRLQRGKAAAATARMTRALGRDVVRSVVTPHVVEPTAMIHEAYRALDELAELE
jgi:hypothetical protein